LNHQLVSRLGSTQRRPPTSPPPPAPPVSASPPSPPASSPGPNPPPAPPRLPLAHVFAQADAMKPWV